MIQLKPSKKLTTDILALFGEKHLAVNITNIDNHFLRAETINNASSRYGTAQYYAKLGDILTEDNIEMLNRTAQKVFEKGLKYQEECRQGQHMYEVDSTYVERDYHLVHPKDWIVKVTFDFFSYPYTKTFRLQGMIHIYQIDIRRMYATPVASFDVGDEAGRVEVKAMELLSTVSDMKESLARKLSDSMFAAEIQEKILNQNGYYTDDDSSEFRWVYSVCPEAEDVRPDYSQDF